MFGARGNVSGKQKKICRIITIGAVVLCLLIELLGHVPFLPFDGWSDVFAWFGMPQAKVIAEDELQVHFINVGNADCILVRQDDHAMLIDAGEAHHGKRLLDYLYAHDVEALDLVIATHPHADHVGAFSAIAAEIPIRRLVLSYMPDGEEDPTGFYTYTVKRLVEQGAQVDEAKAGTTYELGKAKVQILSPSPQEFEVEDANDITVVSRLTYGEHAFLFTGDATMDTEARLLEDGFTLDADVLKVAHHGSKTSTSPAFVKAVSPEYAVFSCGDNDYGHPNDEIVSRLRQEGATIYRTDVEGDIVFVSNGKNLSVRWEKSR